MRTGPKSKFSADDKARVADMLKRGFTQTEVASVLGTTQQSVSRLARSIETETERRQSATWASAVADPESFMDSQPSKLAALRAIGELSVADGIAHSADHPHDDSGAPLKGHEKRCAEMWDVYLAQRTAIYDALDSHDWAQS